VTGPVDAPAPDETAAAHPVTGLDDVVHQRVRLGILTIAHEARRVEEVARLKQLIARVEEAT
jgi:hypothetical protein